MDGGNGNCCCTLAPQQTTLHHGTPNPGNTSGSQGYNYPTGTIESPNRGQPCTTYPQHHRIRPAAFNHHFHASLQRYSPPIVAQLSSSDSWNSYGPQPCLKALECALRHRPYDYESLPGLKEEILVDICGVVDVFVGYPDNQKYAPLGEGPLARSASSILLNISPPRNPKAS